MQDVRVREGDTPGCLPPYSLCLYLCVYVYIYIYIYIYIILRWLFSHKASVHQVSPVDQFGPTLCTNSAIPIRLPYPRYNPQSSRTISIMQSAPKNSACRFYVLTMWVRYAATFKLSNYRYVLRFFIKNNNRNTAKIYLLMFLEDIVLREKFQWPASSYFWYKEAEGDVDNYT